MLNWQARGLEEEWGRRLMDEVNEDMKLVGVREEDAED